MITSLSLFFCLNMFILFIKTWQSEASFLYFPLTIFESILWVVFTIVLKIRPQNLGWFPSTGLLSGSKSGLFWKNWATFRVKIRAKCHKLDYFPGQNPVETWLAWTNFRLKIGTVELKSGLLPGLRS